MLCVFFKTFVLAVVLFPTILSAQTLEITSDGNYISSRKIQLSEDAETLYLVSGVVERKDSLKTSESYVLVGFVPYDSNGKPMQSLNDFPPPFIDNQNGYITLDSLILSKNEKYSFSKKIKLAGEVKNVSFVIGAALSDNAKIIVSELKMLPLKEPEAVKDSMGLGSESNSIKQGVLLEKQKESISESVIFISEDFKRNNSLKKGILSNANFKRTIFVNSDIGSDKLSGLKRIRGQIDGPKKTLKSALATIYNGDHIVLQESNLPYEVSSQIKTTPNQSLVIRAEGTVIIKAKK